MTKLLHYKNRHAVVTGASSGIGRVMARRLAELGAEVMLVARDTQALETLAEEIRQAGGRAQAFPCDVSELEQARATVAAILEHCGNVDILFNNAGYGRHRRFLDWDIEDQERMMRTNYFGMMYFSKLLLPQMVQRKQGWLIFVASVAGKIATPDESAYAASKFATVGLAEALSLELEDDNIHVLTVCPGAIQTPFFDEEALQRMPPVARDNMADPEALVDHILKALARGRHEVTYPKGISMGYIVRALAPRFMRKQVKRVTMEAVKLS